MNKEQPVKISEFFETRVHGMSWKLIEMAWNNLYVPNQQISIRLKGAIFEFCI